MNEAFFMHVRAELFGGKLAQSQVDGMQTIAAAWERYGDGSVQKEAYCFATAYHETARTMQPIHERGAKSYFDKYEPGTAIGMRLGNTVRGDGYRFRGRGHVQLTGRRNYLFVGKEIGIDLLANPERALDPATSARILVVGMMRGWFTGKGLNNYIDDVEEADVEELKEFVAARRTVNGTDKAAVIGGYALKFEAAIKADRGTVWKPPTAPKPAPAPVTPPTPVSPPQPQRSGFWAWLLSVFGRKA